MDPHTALSERPWLWAPVSEHLSGLCEITPEDYQRLSAVHYSARLTMAAAHGREQVRRVRRSRG